MASRNFLKSVLFFGDVTGEYAKSQRDNAVTIQKLEYVMERPRNDEGFPYGPTLQMCFCLELKLEEKSKMRELVSMLNSMDEFSFSIVSNIEFDSNKNMSAWDNLMVLSAYVVGFEEIMHSAEDVNTIVRVDLLTTDVIYKGKDGNDDRHLSIINEDY
ncbi:MAG: hypothetical protein MJZ93_00585 [Paludibacteraceae bacterium]|nr:hypothetical protein [Paludibacteraceae bacterium]